jgi:hypothetical protein
MTVFGVIWGIFVIGGILHLLSEAMKCTLHIDKWSDLSGRKRKEEPYTTQSTFTYQDPITFTGTFTSNKSGSGK